MSHVDKRWFLMGCMRKSHALRMDALAGTPHGHRTDPRTGAETVTFAAAGSLGAIRLSLQYDSVGCHCARAAAGTPCLAVVDQEMPLSPCPRSPRPRRALPRSAMTDG